MNKLISYLVIALSGLILSTTASQAASILLTPTEIELSDPGEETASGGGLVEASGGGLGEASGGGLGEASGGVDPDPGGDGEPVTIPETVPVPEPLTIIGSATALGWGVLLKRESFKKKNKS